jgi:hypothetical protein
MLDGNGNQSTQSTWLSTAVPASTSVWNIAIIHQAPYSTGRYGDIAASQLPYGQYGIDFVISGHNHHFQRLLKADGGADVRYFIDGYGGSLPSGLGHSYCNYSTTAATSEFCLAETPGAIKITASNTSITFQYYSSAGALQNTYTQDAEVPGPTITTAGTLLPFSTEPGTPSAAQSYTVSGSLLTAGILITAPSGFEIATASGGPYSASFTLPQSGGTVASTTIYVRLTGAEGTFSGNITHVSAGATTKNVAVSGTAGWCATVSFQQGTDGYTGARDTYLRQANPTYNYGVATPLLVDSDEPNSSSNDASPLLYWDISSIPAGSTISSASITVNVQNVTDATPGFNLYDMTRAWTEGTGNGSATGNGATWNTYDGSNAWPGGAGGAGAADRGTTALANLAATSTGSYQVSLNAAGLTVLESWANTPANNKGLMIHAGTEDNGMDISSREAVTVTARPKLTIAYCASGTAPTIVTAGTLTTFQTEPGTPSGYQTYTVSGANLTADIHVQAPAGFEIATASGGPYSSSLTLPQSGGTVGSTTIYVRLTGAAEGSFSGNITHTSSGATQKNVAVSGTVSLANDPPEQPVLVRPLDNATGVTLPPTLEVTVTDPDEDDMCVTFYGREAGSAAGEDFSFFVYPDTQNLAASATLAAAFNAMSQYIADNKTALNVAFATSVGDIVNSAGSTTEWGRADAAYDILDAAGVPYSVGPGNHDLGTLYSTNFGNARFSGKTWYGGYYTGANDNYNNYSLFSASGMDFIVINLQYQVGSGALDWADARLKQYSGRRGIVVQHDILNLNNSWLNQTAYNALSDNPNLFLMLCGHMHTTSDGSAYRLQTRTGMDPVHILLTDYQDLSTAPNTGFLRMLTFKPAGDEIYAQVYSPYGNVYRTSESNYEQFTMAYDMAGGAAFEELGQVCNIASGDNASFSWAGLAANTEYEWYAVVADGSESTTGPTWSFTTGTATGTLGDVNGDGDANSTDALIILSADADMNTAQFCPMNCGDVNGDGLVNSTDALIVLSYDAQMTVPFPVGQAGCPLIVTQPPGCGL